MSAPYLILSAASCEAAPSLAMLTGAGISFDFFELGVGPLNAAKSARQAAQKAKGKHVIYLGSAGCFTPFSAPYLVQVEKVWWLPAAERLGLAKLMMDLYPPISIPLKNPELLPIRQVLTSTSVSYTPQSHAQTPRPEILIENMEAYAVVGELLESCSQLDIFLGITNAISPEGSTQWQAHWQEVATLSASFLESYLCS